MANIYRIIAAIIAVFFASNSLAVGNDTPTGDPDDELFDYAFAKTQKTEREKINSCNISTGLGQSISAADLSACTSAQQGAAAQRMSALTSGTDNTYSYYQLLKTTDTIDYKVYDFQYRIKNKDGQVTSTFTFTMRWTYSLGANIGTCPPDDFPDYTLTANLGSTNFCFWPQDIKDRDTCPDSSTDGDFVLPLGTNSASLVCVEKPDGSICGYKKETDYYIADYESSCYQFPQTTYQNQAPEPQDDNDCSKIGNIYTCPENPEDKCEVGGTVNGQQAYSSCESGCGYMDLENSGVSTFVCITEDDDNDGIPNLRDPDYVDEPDEPTEPEEPPTEPPTESERAITDRIDITNKLLGQTNTTLSTISTTTNGILTETKKTNTTLTEIKDDIKKSPVDGFALEPSENLKSFYEPAYENGFDDVWAKHEQAFENSPTQQYIKQWEVTVSGNFDYPQFCVDLGFANYGCHQLTIDGRILAFIRIILIVSALFLARHITLGG